MWPWTHLVRLPNFNQTETRPYSTHRLFTWVAPVQESTSSGIPPSLDSASCHIYSPGCPTWSFQGFPWRAPLDFSLECDYPTHLFNLRAQPHTYVCINTQLWRWPIFQLQNTVSIRGFCQLGRDMEQRAAEGTAVSALFRGSACQAHRCSSYPGIIWPTVMENMILEMQSASKKRCLTNYCRTKQDLKAFFEFLFIILVVFFSPAPAILLTWHPWELLAVEEFVS